MKQESDLLIVGGGPAGLSAAINGASEGLKVTLIDSGPGLGGQARQSSLIENFPGFPDGISGDTLTGSFAAQARKFATEILCPEKAANLRRDGNYNIITTDDGDDYVSKCVILAIGLSWKRHPALGIGSFMGHGVEQGAPTVDPMTLSACTICIIGGANSAGQAAMNFSRNPDIKIKIVVRKSLEIAMSTYLLDRIRACPSIEVIEQTNVTEVYGNAGELEGIVLKRENGSTERMPANRVCVFIGAAPKTFWLNDAIALDEKKFILTGEKLVRSSPQWIALGLNRAPIPFETSMPGVFACGDVRVGSIKRVGSAVGEGTAALQMCHEYLRMQNGNGHS